MNVITNKFIGLKWFTKTKMQILYDHVDQTRFHNVEMGCQMVQLLSAYIVGPTMPQFEPSVNLAMKVPGVDSRAANRK